MRFLNREILYLREDEVPEEVFLELSVRLSGLSQSETLFTNSALRKRVGFVNAIGRKPVNQDLFEYNGTTFEPLVYYTIYDNYHSNSHGDVNRFAIPIVNPHQSFFIKHVKDEQGNYFGLTSLTLNDIKKYVILSYDIHSFRWNSAGLVYENKDDALARLGSVGEEDDGSFFQVRTK